MDDYIPKRDTQKIAWLSHFRDWLLAHGADHGLSPAEVAAFDTLANGAASAFAAHVTAQDGAKAATAAKNRAIGETVAEARRLAQRVQYDPHTTDGDRGEAGLPIRDRKPTRTDGDAIARVTPPLLRLDFGTRQQVTVHWGPNPADERRNGRPRGVLGCMIEVHRGGLPEHEDDWRVLDTDTDSPYVHVVEVAEPATFAYRACYVDRKLKHGPHGEAAVCTVSV